MDVLKPTCYVFEFDPNRALRLVAEYGIRLATTGDDDAAEAIGQLINYLPIFAVLRRRDAPAGCRGRPQLGDCRVGATALAQRWNSPLLVNVNEQTLSAVLDQPDLLETLEQIEDFRSLANNAQQVVTSTKMLKKAKREQGGKLDPEQKKEQKETAKQRKEIREKLQKFLAKIPVFMYVTDFREEALKHVIESLDSGAVRARDRSDGRGLPAAEQHRRVQRPAHEPRDLPVPVVRAGEPPVRGRGRRQRQPQSVGLWDRTEEVS